MQDLELSTGFVPSSQIVAANLDTYHVEMQTSAVALWLVGHDEPLCFPHGSGDAQAVIAWQHQLDDRFLVLPPSHCFAIASIKTTSINDDMLLIKIDGIALSFCFPGQGRAAQALVDWAEGRSADGEATAVLPTFR